MRLLVRCLGKSNKWSGERQWGLVIHTALLRSIGPPRNGCPHFTARLIEWICQRIAGSSNINTLNSRQGTPEE